jgi:O-6-methylguanine DNA methyltransferase
LRTKSRVFRELKGLGVTPGRAARIFRDRFGLTPEGYADLLRAREARRGLSEDGLPVLEVADSLGFESVPAFYAFVRKHTGETPGELRRGGGFPRAAKGSCWVYDTAIGEITIAADGVAVTALAFGERKELAELRRTELTDRAASQLAEYLAGKRRDFTVPLAPEGTAFQRSVWNALLAIPYGETRSYGQIAALIGSPKASRAVGMANNRNPIAILIPCHRVIGADGALVGYGGGLDLKRRLLALERGHRNG